MIDTENALQTYRENNLLIWVFLLVGSFLSFLAGLVFLPELFWDDFLWRYFWGPVVADAKGHPVDGISSGYNPVNTFFYGLILIIAFFGIYKLIIYLDVRIDRKYVYSLLPWIVLGGSLRSLQDAGLFETPLDKFLITPLIYFLLGLSALSLLVLGAYLSELDFDEKERIFRILVLLPIPLIYIVLRGWLAFHSPLSFLIIFGGISLSYILGSKYFKMDEKYLFFSYGITLLLLSLSYNGYYIIFNSGTNAMEAILIPLISVGVTSLFLSALWVLDHTFLGDKDKSQFQLFVLPLNLLITWAHLFDSTATYRGIVNYGYSEKHVVPSLFIEATGTSLIMFPLKMILILAVIYSLDVYLKEEFSESGVLKIFLKFLIIILGAAPAVRNTLRLAMGV